MIPHLSTRAFTSVLLRMSPLRSNVSFSKERNFSFLRRSESLKDKKDGSCETEKRKEGRRRSKDRKRERSKEKAKEASTPNLIQQAAAECRSSQHNSGGFAASLAATLSPFSSFVSSHSPRLSRKGSPSPGRPSPFFYNALDSPSSVKSQSESSNDANIPRTTESSSNKFSWES